MCFINVHGLGLYLSCLPVIQGGRQVCVCVCVCVGGRRELCACVCDHVFIDLTLPPPPTVSPLLPSPPPPSPLPPCAIFVRVFVSVLCKSWMSLLQE